MPKHKKPTTKSKKSSKKLNTHLVTTTPKPRKKHKHLRGSGAGSGSVYKRKTLADGLALSSSVFNADMNTQNRYERSASNRAKIASQKGFGGDFRFTSRLPLSGTYGAFSDQPFMAGKYFGNPMTRGRGPLNMSDFDKTLKKREAQVNARKEENKKIRLESKRAMGKGTHSGNLAVFPSAPPLPPPLPPPPSPLPTSPASPSPTPLSPALLAGVTVPNIPPNTPSRPPSRPKPAPGSSEDTTSIIDSLANTYASSEDELTPLRENSGSDIFQTLKETGFVEHRRSVIEKNIEKLSETDKVATDSPGHSLKTGKDRKKNVEINNERKELLARAMIDADGDVDKALKAVQDNPSYDTYFPKSPPTKNKMTRVFKKYKKTLSN